MIQVCSRCGTRWNVRDRKRDWCPRCQGALLAPSEEPQASQGWGVTRPTDAARAGTSRPAQRLPAGYRWIAVRPGAPPPPRRAAPPLGPTPRYSVIPRWSLRDHVDPAVSAPSVDDAPKAASARLVRVTLLTTLALFGCAALAQLANYALLLYNRSTLLNPIVAGVATWAGLAISVLAFFASAATFVVLINWLTDRRAGAYAQHDSPDPRSAGELWAGCLVPLVNLFWAPVYVLELARVEGRLTWLRTPIVVWWCAWWVSTLVSIFAIATSFTQDVQGIADNTVATVIAYLTGLAALLLTLKMYRRFEYTAVDRPVTRWVLVPDAAPSEPAPSEPAPSDAGTTESNSETRVESDREDPAA